MNALIALLVITSVAALQNSSSSYKSGSAVDSNYISLTEKETDPATLQSGILCTEATRAHAYRVILRLSNNAATIGTLVAAAFLMNSIFIYRLSRKKSAYA